MSSPQRYSDGRVTTTAQCLRAPGYLLSECPPCALTVTAGGGYWSPPRYASLLTRRQMPRGRARRLAAKVITHRTAITYSAVTPRALMMMGISCRCIVALNTLRELH